MIKADTPISPRVAIGEKQKKRKKKKTKKQRKGKTKGYREKQNMWKLERDKRNKQLHKGYAKKQPSGPNWVTGNVRIEWK